MRLFISDSPDPHINLATEEYLLRNSTEDIIFLYRDQPCLVVGKHQNAMAEVNYRFVYENKIPVVRRISGGGTVYHDEGNINFTFLQNGEEGNLVNFRTFIAPIADFLKQYGIPAEIGPRNDILIHNLKVSGNAEHIYRKRTLHHGTLLFSSALTSLRSALQVEPGKYTDRAVKSVRSKVTNIKEYMQDELDVHQFLGALGRYLSNVYNTEPLSLSHEAFSEITDLARSKYADWSWNYGYSPAYTFKNTFSDNNLELHIEFEVEKGMIKESRLSGNQPKDMLMEINTSLCGQPHTFSTISANPGLIHLKSTAGIENSDFFWSFF